MLCVDELDEGDDDNEDEDEGYQGRGQACSAEWLSSWAREVKPASHRLQM